MELRAATARDREAIYRIRHDVYARELGQHPVRPESVLSDDLDGVNEYLVAALGSEIHGFVSITPPWAGRYSVDKYVERAAWPALGDAAGLFEVRLLTVRPEHRGTPAAVALMYAALRWAASRGARHIVAIGRAEVLDLYRRVGFHVLGHRFRSGAVTFELMVARVSDLTARWPRADGYVRRVVDRWRLDVPLAGPRPDCSHGGASFDAIGPGFDALDRRHRVVVADVLDAWFPPAPGALPRDPETAGWLARSSPPVDAAGLVRAIATARNVPAASVTVGAGSSDLVYRAFGRWLSTSSRVLLPDPTYGEYAHVIEAIIGARVDRLPLSAADGWRLDPTRLAGALATGQYDLAVVVNPNNPTGRYLPRAELTAALAAAPPHTRVWIDEAYLEYAVPGEQSLERLAATRAGLVVCKSMSKVYALSGMRVAYLVTEPSTAATLRAWTPPWVVGLPAQVAAVAALADPDHYTACWSATTHQRTDLVAALRDAGYDITDSATNSVLLTLPPDGPSAPELVQRLRHDGIYLRDLSSLSAAFAGRTVRIAVRPQAEQHRIVAALRSTRLRLPPTQRPPRPE